MTNRILRIDASARRDGSVTRALTDRLIGRFREAGPAKVSVRDLSFGLPQIDEAWIEANFTAAEDRTEAHDAKLALSDELVDELVRADIVVIGLPIYNFTVPASFKAWIDLVSRAGVTFRYAPDGPEGLLKGKRAIVAVASGGTAVGSGFDFATGYLRHMLGFLGITDVEIVSADQTALDLEGTVRAAEKVVDALPLAA